MLWYNCDVDLIGVMRGSDVTVDVSWFQDSVPVRTDSRVSISGVTGDEDGGHSSLSFSSIQFSDMATYECHVTLTPLLGQASPVSSNSSIFLDITGVQIFTTLIVDGNRNENTKETSSCIPHLYLILNKEIYRDVFTHHFSIAVALSIAHFVPTPPNQHSTNWLSF